MEDNVKERLCNHVFTAAMRIKDPMEQATEGCFNFNFCFL